MKRSLVDATGRAHDAGSGKFISSTGKRGDGKLQHRRRKRGFKRVAKK